MLNRKIAFGFFKKYWTYCNVIYILIYLIQVIRCVWHEKIHQGFKRPGSYGNTIGRINYSTSVNFQLWVLEGKEKQKSKHIHMSMLINYPNVRFSKFISECMTFHVRCQIFINTCSINIEWPDYYSQSHFPSNFKSMIFFHSVQAFRIWSKQVFSIRNRTHFYRKIYVTSLVC